MASFTLPTSKNIWNFDPTSIAGCTLWLDGADPNTLFSDTGGTTAATVGGSVARWSDKSIRGTHATQSTAGNRPTRASSGGINCVATSQTGGTFLGFATPTNFPSGTENATYFTVSTFIYNASVGLGPRVIISHGANVDSQSRVIADRQTGLMYFSSTGGNITGGSNSIVADITQTSHILSCTLNNQIASIFYNGNTGNASADSQASITPLNTVNSLAYVGNTTIGGSEYGTYNGNISEILVFNSALSNTDRQTIEGYLAWKWNLQTALPASHPFNANTLTPYFTPNNIGASLWYDASDSASVFLDAVYQWSDKSVSNNHVTQGKLSLSPLYTASNGITFDGFSNQLLFTAPNFIAGVNFTFFVVERRTVSKASNYFLSGSLPSTNRNLHVGYNSDNPFVGYYSNDHGGTSIGAYTTPVTRIFKFNLTTTGRTIYINGTQSGTTNATVTKLIDYPGGAVGGGSQGYYKGAILEMICYTNASANATSFDNDQRIEGYLAQKWGILASLPGAHPYITGPPVDFVDPKVSVSGCALWLDSADTATILRTVYWQNKTARTAPGRNSTGNPTYQTNIVNGKNAILCADSTEAIQLNFGGSINFNFTNGQVTFFAVPYTTATGGNIVDFESPTYFSCDWTTSEIKFSLRGTNSPTYSNSNLVGSNKQFILGITSDGNSNTGALYVNGYIIGSFTTGTTSRTTIHPVLSKDNTAGPTYFCEVIGVTTLVTPLQRQRIEGYLAWKWGLQASLPATHPYALANYFYSNTRPFLRNFVPNDISNCIMWYDGADLTTMFTNTAGTNQVPGTATAANNRIRLWRDKSGMGNNLTGASDDASPTLTISTTNPRKFDVVFDGGDYLSNTALVNNSNTYTKFLVFYRNDTAAINYERIFSYATNFGDQFNNDPSGFHIQGNNSKTNYIVHKSNTGVVFNIVTDTYYIVTIVADPRTMSLFLNGSLSATASLTLPNTDFSGTTFRLGTNFFPGSNSYWSGRINEVISYNRQLSTYEYQEVEGYLAWKWGLRSSLPATHPFFRFPTPSTAPVQPELQLYGREFSPSDLDPIIWIDPQDASSINLDTTTNRILTIKSKTNPTRSLGDVPITLLSVTSTSFTVSLISGLVIGSSITPLTAVAGTPGLAANTAYFIASISGNVVTVASTVANARSGTAISGFTTNASLNVTANTTIAISPNFQILSVASNVFTITSTNGLTIGTEFVSNPVAGTPGLIAQTLYYVSLISGNTIRAATSLANAFNGIHMTGFTDNPSLSNIIGYYNFSLIKPPTISGPLLATSCINNGPSLKYMECLNGGVFKLASAVISGTTLTLRTQIPHNIPAGRQINLNILSGNYGTFGPSVLLSTMGPFHVSYASVSGASGTILTLNTSTDSGIATGSSVYLQVNTASYNAGSGGSAVDLTQGYTVPANISVTANSSTTGTNVVTLSSVTGLALGQGIRFTTTFGGIPINTTHYINSISGNDITISTSPFGVNRTLTTSATGSGGTAGTFNNAIVLTLPTAKTVGPIRLGDISIRNNGGLVGPYIVATSGSPNANTLTVTTYSTLTASTLGFLVGRIEYGLLSLSSANLTSTTSMTIFTPIPHGLNFSDTLSTSFTYLINPNFSSTFTTATVNAAGTLLTITGLSDTTIFTTTGQSTSLYIPPGTTFANGVQAAGISAVNIATQTGTNGSTVVFTISTAAANAGILSFVTGQSGSISLGPFTGGGSANLNTNLYTVTDATSNSFTFTTPTQPKSGNIRGQSGCDSFVSSSPSNNSFFNFPVNGYALENTLLGGALVSRFVTMVYVSHLTRNPSRSTLSSPVQSPIIATSVSVNGPGGDDNVLFGRDYRIQVSFNAGTSRFQLKHNAVGVNQNPNYTSAGDLGSNASPFRVHSMIINTNNTNSGDINAFTKCMAVNGWRYSNCTTSDVLSSSANVTTGGALTTTVTGIKSTVGFTVGSSITKIGGDGNFGTGTTITSINSATQITVTGTSNHTAGSISFRVVPPNSLLNTSFANVIGNIQTTSYLRPTHLRIGGDTSATTDYATSPLCGSWYEGGIGDILIFNTILSVEQRQLVEGFLAQKYNTAGTLGGLTTTIGSSFIHPYRTNPTSISSTLDLTQGYTQGLATWFDASNSSTIGLSSGNFVNSWTSAGGNVEMVLANTLSSTNWSNPTYVKDANARPYLKFIRIQYPCTTVSVDASNGIRITSPNIVPVADQTIVFSGTLAPLGSGTVYFIKSVVPISGNDYTITVSTTVGGATSSVTQNASPVVTTNINRVNTLKSIAASFPMAPQFTTQGSNNEYTNILVFSRDGTVTSASGGLIINYVGSNNTRITIEDGGRRCDYNFGGSAITTQLITYGSATLVSNIPYILIVYRRGRTNFTRLIGNNTIVNTTVNNSFNLALTATNVSLRMGSYDQPDGFGNSFGGGIYENMLFKYALTDQAIYQIEGYLAWKWGLQNALPTTHPYYKIRP